jgi:tRNA 2-thiocytidine biosynthesis protein TtcA
MKRLVHELEEEIPHLKRSMLHAMGNIQPRHLLNPHFACNADLSREGLERVANGE